MSWLESRYFVTQLNFQSWQWVQRLYAKPVSNVNSLDLFYLWKNKEPFPCLHITAPVKKKNVAKGTNWRSLDKTHCTFRAMSTSPHAAHLLPFNKKWGCCRSFNSPQHWWSLMEPSGNTETQQSGPQMELQHVPDSATRNVGGAAHSPTDSRIRTWPSTGVQGRQNQNNGCHG